MIGPPRTSMQQQADHAIGRGIYQARFNQGDECARRSHAVGGHRAQARARAHACMYHNPTIPQTHTQRKRLISCTSGTIFGLGSRSIQKCSGASPRASEGHPEVTFCN